MRSQSNDRTHNSENGFFRAISDHKNAVISAATSLLTLIAVFLFWHIAAIRIDLPFILPKPLDVLKKFVALIPTKEFISAVTGSMFNVISGYIGGVLAGALLALASFLSYPVKAVLAPFVKVARTVPVASFILLCILWMTDNVASAFIGAIMVFPIVYENVLAGFAATDVRHLEMARAYGFGKFKTFTKVYIPSALPYLGSASASSLGLAWKACVSAEVLCIAEDTIGYYIFNSKDFFDTEQLFAWTVAVVIMSLFLEGAVKIASYFIKRRLRRSYGR
jgi:NitT/TauT family transport system permease protein